MNPNSFAYSYSSKAVVNATARSVFEYLDDPTKLSAHMGKSSMMMAGSKMTIEVDPLRGREVGSVIKMSGKILGLNLSLEEKIIERQPFEKKTWQTFGQPKLLILDQYKMSFILKELGPQTELNVFIEYNLPKSGFPKILGSLLGKLYAKWCTEQMLKDTKQAFPIPSCLRKID